MFYKNKLYCYIFYFLRHYFDCIDGFLARKTGQVSQFGDIYDHGIDRSFGVAFIISIYMLSKTPKLDIIVYLILSGIGIMGHLCYIKDGNNSSFGDKYDKDKDKNDVSTLKNLCIFSNIVKKGGVIIIAIPMIWIISKL